MDTPAANAPASWRCRRVAAAIASAVVAVAVLAGADAAAARRHAAKHAPAHPAAASVPPQTWDEQQSALCTAAIGDAQGRYKLPGGLLGAVAHRVDGQQSDGGPGVAQWPEGVFGAGAVELENY